MSSIILLAGFIMGIAFVIVATVVTLTVRSLWLNRIVDWEKEAEALTPVKLVGGTRE